jgi:diaminopimelate epimerase
MSGCAARGAPVPRLRTSSSISRCSRLVRSPTPSNPGESRRGSTLPGVSSVRFAKTEAHGNDFLLVSRDELAGRPEGAAPLARAICHRLRGVGADGLILFGSVAGEGDRAREPESESESESESEFEMTLFNSDGSSAEISGNGLRCLGAYLAYRGLAGPGSENETLRVRTGAGTLSLELLERHDRRFRFRANMGRPRLAAREVPFVAEPDDAPAVSVPLEVGSEILRVTAVSMGNPHAVLFTDADDAEELRRMGPSIESHPRFPNKTNVELVQVLSPHRIRMRIWERGAGETASSGTGSAASAVASILERRARSPVEVLCDGGTITVEWDSDGDLFLTGDAVVVAEGTYFLAES